MAQRIISADSHVIIRHERVLANMSATYRDAYEAALAAARQPVGPAHKPLRNKPTGLTMTSRISERYEQRTDGPQRTGVWEAAGRPGEYDPHERLKDMDMDRVDAEVLYSEVTGGMAFYRIPDEGCIAAFRAFNDAAMEFGSVNPDRLVPVYLLPLHDIEAGIKEVQRLANEGARAIQVPVQPVECDLAPFWDEVYDPLWSALEELDMPISQHVGTTRSLSELMGYDPTPAKGIAKSLPPIFLAESIATWVISGIFVKHPRLRVVLVEAGLAWIPYFLDRMDKMKERHHWDDVGMPTTELPSYYWHQNMAATFEEDVLGVSLRDRIGFENMMWATDYPHPDTTWPRSQEAIIEHFGGVEPEAMRRMVSENAAAIYHL